MKKIEGVVKEISELRNTTLSPHSLNTIMAIVMSSPAKLHRNGVLVRACYLPTGVEYGYKWHKVLIMVKWKTRERLGQTSLEVTRYRSPMLV